MLESSFFLGFGASFAHIISSDIGSMMISTVLNARGEAMEAYDTCHGVLTQLREAIPRHLNPEHTVNMIDLTSKLVKGLSETDLMEMKEMDKKRSISLKFYSLLARISYISKPKMFGFLVCRMVQLTIEHGVCKYSILGFVQFAVMLSNTKLAVDIQNAWRLGGKQSCPVGRDGSVQQSRFQNCMLHTMAGWCLKTNHIIIALRCFIKDLMLGCRWGKAGLR